MYCISRHTNSIIITLVLVIISFRTYSHEAHDEELAKVTLRMIGHELLLGLGDSSSRVLPIKGAAGNYTVQFERNFLLSPDLLVAVVSNVMSEIKKYDWYIVEVEDCVSKEVVYSFQVDNRVESEIIPCQGRDLPASCYNLVFNLQENESNEDFFYKSSLDNEGTINSGNNTWVYLLLLLPVPFLVYLFIRSRGIKKLNENSNEVRLGNYKFDKKNLILSYNDLEIELTGKEADLLSLLHEKANSTVEKESILNLVWGDEGDYIGRTLDVFISKLRKKLEFDSSLRIINIRGVGYKLVVNE